MTVKEYLKQYKYAADNVERLRAEYDKEVEQIDSISSPLGGDGMPSGGRISKALEDRAIRLAEKATEWKQAELNALEIRQEIFRTLNQVEGVRGTLLIEKYLNLKAWREVADCIGYSASRTYELHNEALEILADLIKAE